MKKNINKKTTIKISPKDAEKVLNAELTDSRGNKINILFNFKPHSHKDPTIKWERQYNDGGQK